MNTATTRTATYKGRTYRLLFLGSTKYGRRAHLQFLDGTKNFWADGTLVIETTTMSRSDAYSHSLAGQCGCACHYGRGGTHRACASCRFDGCAVVEAMGIGYDH